MPALTRRQVLTTTGGGLAAVAVSGLVGNAVVRVLAPTLFSDLSQATAFGRVAVLGARRDQRVGGRAHSGGYLATGTAGDRSHLAPEHQPWSDVVHVDVEVHNASGRPVLVSPGQFRLRVGRVGPSVSLYDAGHQVLALAAGATLATWVGFLVPPEESAFGIEYTEAGAARAHAFQIAPEVLS